MTLFSLRSRVIMISLVFLVAQLLSGCSLPMNLFVVNKAQEPVTAQLHMTGSVQNYLDREPHRFFKYTDAILTGKNKNIKKLTDQLPYTIVDDNTVSVIFPPQSTVLVGTGMNTIITDSVTLTRGGETTSYSHQEFTKLVKRTGGLTMPVNLTYIIE